MREFRLHASVFGMWVREVHGWRRVGRFVAVAAVAVVVAGCGSARGTHGPAASATSPVPLSPDGSASAPASIPGGSGEPAPSAAVPSCGPFPPRHAGVQMLSPDGKLAWSKPLPLPSSQDGGGGDDMTAPIADATTVFTTIAGDVRAFALSDGSARWTDHVGTSIYGVWLTSSDLVVLADQVSQNATIRGIDTASGATRWVYHVPGGGLLGDLAMTDDGGLAMVTDAGDLQVIDTATGAVRWRASGQREQPWFATAPGVVVRTDGDKLTAYGGHDGKIRWQDSGFAGTGQLLAGAGVVVTQPEAVTNTPVPLVGVDVASGSVRWRLATPAQAQPLGIGPAGVLVDEWYGTAPILMLLDAETGAQRWAVHTSAAIDAGEAIVLPDAVLEFEGGNADQPDQTLVLRDAAAGAVRWHAQLGTHSHGQSLNISGHAVIALTLGQTPQTKVWSLDADTGALGWTATLPYLSQRGPVLLDDGSVVAQDEDPGNACAA